MVKRVLVAILAVLLLVVGGALGTAAIWAHSAFDENGVMHADAGRIDPGTDARSTIIDVDRFEATVPYIGELGTTRLTVMTGERGDPSNTLFIGAAATPDVDAFVKGSAYAVALRDGSEWITREVPGALIPPLPRDQQFWLAQDVGRNPGIVVPADRPLTLLVMHPSGVPSGPLLLSIDFAIPQAGKWVLGMAIAAVILVIIGIGLIILVIRMRGRRGRHEAAAVIAAEEPVVVSAGTEEATEGVATEEPPTDAVAVDDATAVVPAIEAGTEANTGPDTVVADVVEPGADDAETSTPQVADAVLDEAVADETADIEAPVTAEEVTEPPVAQTLFDAAPAEVSPSQTNAESMPEEEAEERADPSATKKDD